MIPQFVSGGTVENTKIQTEHTCGSTAKDRTEQSAPGLTQEGMCSLEPETKTRPVKKGTSKQRNTNIIRGEAVTDLACSACQAKTFERGWEDSPVGKVLTGGSEF